MMATQPNDPAYPMNAKTLAIPAHLMTEELKKASMEIQYQTLGLTKREYFAAMAMQGLLCANWPQGPAQDEKCSSAHFAVLLADALIAELNKNG